MSKLLSSINFFEKDFLQNVTLNLCFDLFRFSVRPYEKITYTLHYYWYLHSVNCGNHSFSPIS